MTFPLKKKIIQVCDKKIEAKDSNVGLFFMLFLRIKMIILNC